MNYFHNVSNNCMSKIILKIMKRIWQWSSGHFNIFVDHLDNIWFPHENSRLKTFFELKIPELNAFYVWSTFICLKL